MEPKERPLGAAKCGRYREKESGQNSSSCRHPQGYGEDGNPITLAKLRLAQVPGQDPGVLGNCSFPPAKDVELASRVAFKGSLAASPKGPAIPAP